MIISDLIQYSVTDFLLDESFQKWALHQQSASAESFSEWLEQQPEERRYIVEQARLTLVQVRAHLTEQVSQDDFDDVWLMISKSIDAHARGSKANVI
jgi:type II secretory pathway component PulM